MLPQSLLLALLLAVSSSTSRAEPLSCRLPSSTTKLANSYDFSQLSSIQTIDSAKDTPPTKSISHVRMQLCGGDDAGLPKEDGVADEDQCPPNTLVCLQLQNEKPSQTPPLRTLAVIPIVGSQIPGIDLPLVAKWTEVRRNCPEERNKDKKCTDLQGEMGGGSYNGQAQQMKINLHCTDASSSEDHPTLTDYSNDILSLNWNTQHACPADLDGSPSSPPSGPASKGGRGFFGWLFLLLLFIPPIYLALGIYHNRTTYGAHGWDAIPHKEFWMDFPSLVKDLGSHLLGGFRSRTSGGGGSGRGGYESLDAA